MRFVVAITHFLDSDVGQVNHHIVKFSHVARVFLRAEAGESPRVQVHFQRLVTRDEHVHAQVEFLAADEERLFYVSRNDVVLLEIGSLVILNFGHVGPLPQLRQLIHQEYAFALRPVRRLHDPGHLRRALEFFLEKVVVSRQLISQRHDVEVDEGAGLVALGERRVFLFHLFAESLDVLNH